jgi:hypothetical protein
LAALRQKYGPQWHFDRKFLGVLPRHHQEQLAKAITDEQKQHGPGITDGHVISGMSFGFLCQLATKSFDHLLWQAGVQTWFPNAPATMNRHQLWQHLDTI